jgi:hypothetical protein
MITRCMILALVMVFVTAGMAFAGVGGSDVPTVTSPVVVGQTGLNWSFEITNQSSTPNDVNTMQITDAITANTGIYFTTTCGSALTPALPCPGGAQEAPNTITINPLIATGGAGTACAGVTFTVAPTAVPNEYSFTPDTTVILGDSATGGAAATCVVNFTVDVNTEPVNDSSGSAGLQTSQLARVSMEDTQTAENGFAAGSSTVAVQTPCLHVEKSCTDAATCVDDIQVSVTATNCGTEALNTLSVVDNMAGTLTCAATTLAPDASTTCTGSYSGVVGGDSTDTITASAVGAVDGATVDADGTSILEATCSTPDCPASLAISKTCTDAATCVDSADFTVTVTNDCVGATCQAVNNITVTDGDCTLTPDPSTPFDLAVGANKVFTCSIPSPTPGTSADVTNTANASGTAALTGDTVNATPDPTNSATCNIPGCPVSLAISKTCTDAATCVDSADFTVTVTNDCVSTTGNPCQDVNNITVTDGDCTLTPDPSTPFNLTEGSSKVFTCSIPSPTPGVSADVTNTATASGTAAVTAVTVDATPDPTNSATCNIPGCPCQVQITKTVAPDDGSGTGNTACDGIADGPFVESVTVQPTDCVVYNICVTNSCTDTDCQTLDTTGVTVSDDHLGIVTENFGEIAPGATVCKLVASEITSATACPGGVCVCQDVEGTNTAVVSSAICEDSGDNACDQTGSVCSDTANVACLQEVGCRMTGGHNNDITTVDADYEGNGQSYTTGGQIGAPTNVGCCPEGPTNRGHNSDCPWGEWEHNHHAGPDDSYIASGGTTGIAGGSFAFHSGTASDPKSSFIENIICADPGWCVQARPAPVKQIYWEGIGVFHNMTAKKGQDEPLPYFEACGEEGQPVAWSNKVDGTLHYYRAHVGDFGEPAGVRQKDPSACTWSNNPDLQACVGGTGLGGVSISECELVDGYCPFSPAPVDQKFTDVHPLCTAQDCGCVEDDGTCDTNKTGCPDYYEIEIHCTTDPASPIAYKVAHFITQGNFQLHPAVGGTCNPDCGNGICEPYVPEATSPGEDCASCPEDCGPCID